jgi:hypothetical protein
LPVLRLFVLYAPGAAPRLRQQDEDGHKDDFGVLIMREKDTK